ncbi:MAG TPA: dihydroorotate dehydrogenase electron transfer subunit, partial [Geomonas sp.]
MQFKSMVVSNVEVSPCYYRMRMTAPLDLLQALPGQFLMLKVNDAIDPLLRRPFGFFDAGSFSPEYSGSGIQAYAEILYKVVGKGTR